MLQNVSSARYPAHPRSYRACVVVLSVALIGLLAFLGAREGAPALGMTAILAALVIASENRDRLFGDETSISGSIAVAVASIVAFRGSTPLLGPLVCAACGGLYWPHIRNRDFSKLIINSASIGLSALAGAAILRVASPAGELSLGKVLLFGTPVVLVYWLVNSIVLAIASLLLRGGKLFANAKLLLRSETQMLGFAIGGAICGYVVLQHSIWLGAVFLVFLLLVIDVVVIVGPQNSARGGPSFASLLMRLTLCSVVASAALLSASRFHMLIALFAVSAIGMLLSCAIASVALRRRLGVWDLRLATGVAIADAPLVVLFAAGGLLAAEVDIPVAAVSVAAALAIGTLASRWLDRHRSVEAEHDDDALMTAIEIALLDSHDVSASSR